MNGFSWAVMLALPAIASAQPASPSPSPIPAATRAEKPLTGPPAAWVREVAVPADTAKPDEAAIRVLLQDQQARLTDQDEDYYAHTAVRVQTAQGLTAMGTIALSWRPDTSSLTVHVLRILRDGKPIDLLKNGEGFTVLRRENNLEYAALDGALTAALQPEGLQVGDIVEMATTIRHRDPVLAGHPEALMGVLPTLPIGQMRLRMVWDSRRPLRWRQVEGLPAARERRVGATTELTVSADALEPLLLPRDAPPRFQRARLIEASGFADWNEISALFAPLYDKAATILAGSPLAAEVARIAAASPDPAKRAEAALRLTQDQVRYVFLGMNDGNLVPAAAADTWARRFGDCKGKTALLLALLKALGIEAAPALVSVRQGDGLDGRLPLLGLFDHVIVRAGIAGRTYWLDGTRTGDARLADIQVPPFRWALPVRAGGTGLERLVQAVPDQPLTETALTIDARAGVTLPSPAHAETIMRGDAATLTRMALANMTPAQRDQALRDYWKGEHSEIEPKTVTAAFDPATGEEKLAMDGTAAPAWKNGQHEADGMTIGYSADFARSPGPHSDAPFAVGFPDHYRATETMLLPGDGEGFTPTAADLDRTIAGIAYRRTSKVEKGAWRVELLRKAVAPEFAYAEGPAAQAVLRDQARVGVRLKVGSSGRATKAEEDAFLARAATTPEDWTRRGAIFSARNDLDAAAAAYDKALAMAPASLPALEGRLGLAERRGDNADMQTFGERLANAEPDPAKAAALRATRKAIAGDATGAVALLDKAISAYPDRTDWRRQRAILLTQLDRLAEADADYKAVIRLDPQAMSAYLARANLAMRRGKPDEVAAIVAEMLKANPDSDYAWVLAGASYSWIDRPNEAASALAKSLAIHPTVFAYLTRASCRAATDLDGRRADYKAALALEPDNDEVIGSWARLEESAGRQDVALDLLKGVPAARFDNPYLRAQRGMILLKAGQAEAGRRDIAEIRRLARQDAWALNNIGYELATANLELPVALAMCGDALALQPGAPAMLDSKGFVLLRLGREREAEAAYDAALAKVPNMAIALYGRALARRRLGDAGGAAADMAAALKADPKVVDRFKGYGLTG